MVTPHEVRSPRQPETPARDPISEAQDQDDALTLAERLRVRLHLLLCADCRHFKHNTEALHQIMKRYADINEDGQAAGSDAAPQDAGDAPRKPVP